MTEFHKTVTFIIEADNDEDAEHIVTCILDEAAYTKQLLAAVRDARSTTVASSTSDAPGDGIA